MKGSHIYFCVGPIYYFRRPWNQT